MARARRYKTVPNCDLARPTQRSPIPNFYLAGAPLTDPRCKTLGVGTMCLRIDFYSTSQE